MSDSQLFLNDIYLSGIVGDLDQYALICINVYDVLLFSAAGGRDAIFEEIGKRLDSGYTPETFRNFRVLAEKRAKKKAKEEGRSGITLKEVYAQLSRVSIDDRAAMELEFIVEREFSYINPNAYSFIKYCSACGKRVVLSIDTCFSGDQIKALLESAGFDCSYINQMLVSSERGISIKDSCFFNTLSEFYPDIQCDIILYIGSEPVDYIVSAAKAKLRTFWYPVVLETNCGIFAMERDCFSRELVGLASLRSLAMSSVPQQYKNGDDKLWFQVGCATLGAIYTLFAEWVVERAVRLGIKRILCFMRDGALLAEFIRRAAENQRLDFNVSTFYISRKAAFLPGCAEVSKDMVTQMVRQSRLTLDDLFTNLCLDIKKTRFASISNKTIKECRQSGAFSAVYDYLVSGEVLSVINKSVVEQRKMLLEYIRDMTRGEKTITIDAGMHGSIQRSLYNALYIDNIDQAFEHLLMVGSMQNDELLLDGVSITAFISYPGESEFSRPPLEFKAFIYELCCGADTGVTLRYTRKHGKVVPVLAEINDPDVVVRNKHIFQSGMLAFQSLWFSVRHIEPLQCFTKRKAGLYAILRRFIQMPLSYEARLVGTLISDDGYGMSDRIPIAPKINNASFKESKDIDNYIREGVSGKEGTLWLEGMVENTFPNYFFDAYRDKYMPVELLRLRKFLPNKRVAIYGASLSAILIAKAAWEYDIFISFIVDKNPVLWGAKIYNIPVISPEDSVGKIDVYIIAPLIYEQEIRQQIKKLHDGVAQPEIFLRNEI